MNALESTIRKIDQFIDRIRALRAGDFAQTASAEALSEIQSMFEARKTELLAANASDVTLIQNHCRLVLGKTFQYLPLLGFLHRSKNASNPFEFYGPLHTLAQQVIGKDARLILSSEWAFSPWTIVRLPDFPNYVLVGMPATEARNALLIPLAGHEFGHSVWARQRLSEKVKAQIQAKLVVAIRARIADWKKYFPTLTDESLLGSDTSYIRAYLPAYSYALKQCEETFCDCMGLWLFETAYFHAFAYLVAPGLPGARNPTYPTLRDRARYLVQAAKDAAITAPTDYENQFLDQPTTVSSSDQLLVALADDTVAAMLTELRAIARDHISNAKLARIDSASVDAVVREYKLLAPAAKPDSLRTIVAAAWQAEANSSIWKEFPHLNARRHDVLNELAIKSAQVLEFNQRVQGVL